MALPSRTKSFVFQVGQPPLPDVYATIRNRNTRMAYVGRDYFLRTGAEAFLIRAAALAASASFSNPNIAEYLLPTTCAITKLRFIPASPIAFARACPSPRRLSPWTSRAGIGDGARPAVFAAAVDFLPETGCSLIAALSVLPG
jgi:hypothetical protein